MHRTQRALFAAAILTLAAGSFVFAQTAPPPSIALPTGTSAGYSSHTGSGYTSLSAGDGQSTQGEDSSRSSDSAQSGSSEKKTLSGTDIAHLIASRVASSNIVVPNAAASRTLIGATATKESENASVQGAKLIESLRQSDTSNVAKTIQSVVQTIETHTSSDTRLQDFINTVAEGVVPTASSTQTPALPPIRRDVVTTVSNSETGGSKTSTATTTGAQGEKGTRTETPAVAPTMQGNQQQVKSQQVRDLEQIGSSLHAIDTAKQSVQKQVSDFVSRVVDTTVGQAERQNAIHPQPSVQGFDEAARQTKLQEIRQNVSEQGADIAKQVSQSVLQGAVDPQQVDPVLKSSLQDIAALVQAQSGVTVSAPLGDRAVTSEIQSATQDIAQNQQVIAQRDGLDLYRDTDHDGISDYDEVHIYHTDPNNAYTGGGDLTDGERVLLGLDPHVAAIKPVPVESPQSSGVETSALYEVTNIALVGTTSSAEAGNTTGVSAPAATSSTPTAPAPQEIRFSGRGLPNSFVTLYIFSEPVVVTVKTDQNGLWTYTLNQPLPDGQHQLYVATVDDQGKILAKSSPVPFTKTAEALSYTPLTIQEVTGPSPLDTLREHFLVTAGVLLLLFVLVGIFSLGFRTTTGTAA